MLCLPPTRQCHPDSSAPAPPQSQPRQRQAFPRGGGPVRPAFLGMEQAFVSRKDAPGVDRKNALRRNSGNAVGYVACAAPGTDVFYLTPNSTTALANPSSRPRGGLETLEAMSIRVAAADDNGNDNRGMPSLATHHHQKSARSGSGGGNAVRGASVGPNTAPAVCADQPLQVCQVGDDEPGLVTYHVAEYSRTDREMLRRQLALQLQRVRNVIGRVESFDAPPPVMPCAKPPLSPLPSPLLRLPPPTPDNNTKLPVAEKRKKEDSLTKKPKSSAKITKTGKKSRTTVPKAEKHLSNMMKRCAQILRRLMRAKDGYIFNEPVDVVRLGLYDYNRIIKRPMDLGTVSSNLAASQYTSPSQFAEDVRLTFNNAVQYNPEGHYIHVLAAQRLRMFEKLYRPANQKYEKHLRAAVRAQETEREKRKGDAGHGRAVTSNKKPRTASIVLPDAVSVEPRALVPAPPPRPVLAAPMAAIPRPQLQPPAVPEVRSLPPTRPSLQQPAAPAKHPVQPEPFPPRSLLPKRVKLKRQDPGNREMSWDEKTKLLEGLQALNSLSPVCEIVNRRQPEALVVEGKQTELMFEALHNETLWEINSLIRDQKKGQGKEVDKVERAVENRGKPIEGVASVDREDPGDEDDVDIGDEMPPTHYPSVMIDPDDNMSGTRNSSDSTGSSSSSCSSSSSTTSDSDSAGSSDSD